MDVNAWLLESDPSIRWQVMRDLLGSPPNAVAAERARVAEEGWGKALLDLQWDNGSWDGGAWGPADFTEETWKTEGQAWTSTMWTLALLADLGVDAANPRVVDAIGKVAANVKWEYAGEDYFDGEVEACINGRTVRAGEYFGRDMTPLVEKLLTEQKPDGGWNCFESEVSSFDSTLAVLEGFVQFVANHGPSERIDASIDLALEYMYSRRLFRGLRSGEPVQEYYLFFTFPNRHNYHVLRILDLIRESGRSPDPRAAEAIDIIRDRRGDDGRWTHEGTMRGRIPFVLEERGEPGRWTTLIATRVLKWWDAGTPTSGS